MKLTIRVPIEGNVTIEAEATTIKQAASDIEALVGNLDFGDLTDIQVGRAEFVDAATPMEA